MRRFTPAGGAGLLTALALGLAAVSAAAAPPVRLATTTSTHNSGLLEHILPAFEARHGAPVHVLAVGTGRALRLGASGDVDLVMTHAPDLERTYLERGAYVNRQPLMYNRFVLLGPPADPAGAAGAPDVLAALRRIAGRGARFISRGDRSGTHVKEQALWQAAGIRPQGAWYQEVGQGMGAALRIADERRAYTLSDNGTYFAFAGELSLHILSGDDPALANPYAVMAVSPQRHPHVNHEGAMALIRWLTSPEGQRRIGAYRRQGRQLFHPGTPPAGGG